MAEQVTTPEVDYHKYMASREWALKREAVKERASNICERCQEAYIADIHHLTYKHLGNEPLDDLQGLCRPCHKFISAKSTDDPIDLLMMRLLKQGVSLVWDNASYNSLPWFKTSTTAFGFYYLVWFCKQEAEHTPFALALGATLTAYFIRFNAK